VTTEAASEPLGATSVVSKSAQTLFERVVKSNFYLTCLAYCALNYRDSLAFSTGDIETGSGTLHATYGDDESVRYIEEVYLDYMRYGGFERFHGRVAEIGPGDNCGVAMLMAGDNVEHVDLVDRYYSRRDSARQARVYERLLARHADAARAFASVDLADESRFPRLTRHYGPAAAAEQFFRTHRDYDFIVSRAVMEHLYDPLAATRDMAAALAPGGVMVHKVDLRDHGMFTPRFQELKFLEVPDWLYPRMTRASGRPNRVLTHEYRRVLDASGLQYELLVTRLAGVGDVSPHLPWDRIAPADAERAVAFVRSVRSAAAPSPRAVRDEDLAVTGLMIVARKRG